MSIDKVAMKEAEEFRNFVKARTNEVVSDDSLSEVTFEHGNMGFLLNRMNVWTATLYDVFTPEDTADDYITAVKDEMVFSVEPQDGVCCRLISDVFEPKQVVLPELAMEAFRNDILNESVPSEYAHFSEPVVIYSLDKYRKTAAVFFSVSGMDERNDRYFLNNFVIVCNRHV